MPLMVCIWKNSHPEFSFKSQKTIGRLDFSSYSTQSYLNLKTGRTRALNSLYAARSSRETLPTLGERI
jgi:hypothetical protein